MLSIDFPESPSAGVVLSSHSWFADDHVLEDNLSETWHVHHASLEQSGHALLSVKFENQGVPCPGVKMMVRAGRRMQNTMLPSTVNGMDHCSKPGVADATVVAESSMALGKLVEHLRAEHV